MIVTQSKSACRSLVMHLAHGLRTPNEGTNLKYPWQSSLGKCKKKSGIMKSGLKELKNVCFVKINSAYMKPF